jgi:signal transduction histidine kinase
MIAGILTLPKRDTSESAIPIDLITTLQSISDDFADRGFKVSFSGSGRLPYRCKRVSIRRCLTNLVENAVK